MLPDSSIKLKVCGTRDPENIQELGALSPDYIGMIFYEKSPRYVEGIPGNIEAYRQLDDTIKKVGVFVNAPIEDVLLKVAEYNLEYVQLHGGESLEYCQKTRSRSLKVIKVFSVSDVLPVSEIKKFENDVDYFLFDTQTSKYGGSGNKFDWTILKEYNIDKPYFLSGGIQLEDIEEIKHLDLPGLYAIDVNSKFEVEPGLKNIEMIRKLTEKIVVE